MDGSSIKITFGWAISARPIATICCSPPDSVPAFCGIRSFTRGNISRPAPGPRPRRRGRAAGTRRSRGSPHRHLAESRRFSGNHRDPAPRPPSSEAGGDLAVEQDLAVARRHVAQDRLQRRRLAARVPAQEAHHLPGEDLDVDVAEHARPARSACSRSRARGCGAPLGVARRAPRRRGRTPPAHRRRLRAEVRLDHVLVVGDLRRRGPPRSFGRSRGRSPGRIRP